MLARNSHRVTMNANVEISMDASLLVMVVVVMLQMGEEERMFFS